MSPDTQPIALQYRSIAVRLLAFSLVGLLYACGGGGGSSSPPEPDPVASFRVNQTSFDTSHTLGQAATTQAFTVTNSGNASGSFSLSTAATWISLSSSSGTLAPGGTQTITATLSCDTPETKTGSISLTGGAGASVSISINHTCSAPPINIQIVGRSTLSNGTFPNSVRGSLSFTISSSWSGQGAVTYNITGTNDVTFEPNTGSISLDESISITMQRNCSDIGDTVATITITIDDVEESFEWTTRCTGNVVQQVQAEYYQGARSAVANHVAQGQSWQTNVLPSSFLILDRPVVVRFTVEHRTNTGPSLTLLWKPDDLAPTVLVQPSTRQSDTDSTLWITDTVYSLPADEITGGSGWELTIESNNQVSGSPINFNLSQLSSSVPADDEPIDNIRLGLLGVETLHIKFVPITRSNGTPDFDPSSYLTHITDLLPAANVTYEKDAPLEADDDPELNNPLLRLAERWLAQSQNPTEFYYGIVDMGDDLTVCGRAYQPGQAAVSESPGPRCSDFIVAHEFGHNLNLGHAPCGTTQGLSSDYPHSDGSTGGEDGWLLSSQSHVPSDVTHYDVMGYCNFTGPTFIARYHFKRAAQNTDRRRNISLDDSSLASKPKSAHTPAAQISPRQLIVTGKVDSSGVFRLYSVSFTDLPVVPLQSDESLPYELVVSDTWTGTQLASKRFKLHEVANTDEAHWFLSLPIPVLSLDSEFSIHDGKGNSYLRADLSEKLEHLKVHEIYIEREP